MKIYLLRQLNSYQILITMMKTVRKIEKGVEESKIVEIAEKEERTILTQDIDFGKLY